MNTNATIPTFTSPSTGTIPVMVEASQVFPILSPAEQREFLDILTGFRAQVEIQGNSAAYLKGISGAAHIRDSDVPAAKAMVLDTCDWKMAQGLRCSTPTRIAEAAPYLERVMAQFRDSHNDGEVDETPEMYLGVALHKTLGQEEAAIAHFRLAFEASPYIQMQLRTQLWARACFSRLLRRMGRISDAEEQEDMIGNWISGHPYAMPPDEFFQLVTDPEHEGKDYILEHLQVKQTLGNIVQIGPGMAVSFG
ncbi:hypothetical protein FB45DRAFT_1059308 [Roridomyces roridus]|uniref:Tetratricopeptide repeat protein n=1 Tax=Roridomyces roridus TaxID=1738132 RepID=A0AAD7BR56_9AGAR|nr:hypothetical protein FB45DRAFT_1059308 [Roridomyces roridus]